MEKAINITDTFKSKDLRSLSRRDLLILMLEQAREIERLREKLLAEEQRHKQEIEGEKQKYTEILKLQKEYADSEIKTLSTLLSERLSEKENKCSAKSFVKKISECLPFTIKRR